jgi:hypothetical protein
LAGSKRIRKDFILGGQWDGPTASRLDAFLTALVAAHRVIREGTYVGTGMALPVVLEDLPGTPILVLIQNDAGLVTIIVNPGSALAVTEWSQKGFTVGVVAAVNTAGQTYHFVVVV